MITPDQIRNNAKFGVPLRADVLMEIADRLEGGKAATTTERELLREASKLLRHTNCIDDDATKCPACSLESRISTLLAAPMTTDRPDEQEGL